ncbi:MAG: hypothetical protein LKJ43_03160 [Lentilactobacillus buchneri]|jgi:hypothetical protein|nr:hypothetical protein [Lentilactobacillus buchneri]MCI1950711.1 hypothetical protein [Lentilactobacillus buchneri]MCI2018213.1 hypothetical protein [Lentilactobacillus buchneri]MCI2027837.1 hypothetical protein [Lentilactobacillus buchneri]
MFKTVAWNGHTIRFRKLSNGWNVSMPDVAMAMGINVNDRYTTEELADATNELELVNANKQQVFNMLDGGTDELSKYLKEFVVGFYRK